MSGVLGFYSGFWKTYFKREILQQSTWKKNYKRRTAEETATFASLLKAWRLFNRQFFLSKFLVKFKRNTSVVCFITIEFLTETIWESPPKRNSSHLSSSSSRAHAFTPLEENSIYSFPERFGQKSVTLSLYFFMETLPSSCCIIADKFPEITSRENFLLQGLLLLFNFIYCHIYNWVTPQETYLCGHRPLAHWWNESLFGWQSHFHYC